MDRFDNKTIKNLAHNNPNIFIKKIMSPTLLKFKDEMLLGKIHINASTLCFNDLNKTVFYIDDENESFAYLTNNTLSKWYNFCDYTEYKVSEAKHIESTTSTSGTILHPPGSVGVYYSDTTTNNSVIVDKLILTLNLNDDDNTEIELNFIDISYALPSRLYEDIYKQMIKNVEMLESHLFSNSGKAQSLIKRQLIEAKELYDDGLISSEEYEDKKSEILGL